MDKQRHNISISKDTWDKLLVLMRIKPKNNISELVEDMVLDYMKSENIDETYLKIMASPYCDKEESNKISNALKNIEPEENIVKSDYDIVKETITRQKYQIQYALEALDRINIKDIELNHAKQRITALESIIMQKDIELLKELYDRLKARGTHMIYCSDIYSLINEEPLLEQKSETLLNFVSDLTAQQFMAIYFRWLEEQKD